jgi:hypothetical protein
MGESPYPTGGPSSVALSPAAQAPANQNVPAPSYSYMEQRLYAYLAHFGKNAPSEKFFHAKVMELKLADKDQKRISKCCMEQITKQGYWGGGMSHQDPVLRQLTYGC